MQFKSITSFIRGLFKNEGKENRVSDNFLTEIHNVDLDLTGKIIRRRGYAYWSDFLNASSVASSLGIPEISANAIINPTTGFGSRIQAIFPYKDVAGIAYLFIVCDGKVFVETYSNSEKKWSCLNPTGNIDFIERNFHIDIKSYLDIVFFNDYRNDVYIYNSQSYVSGGWVLAGNRFIYFAGDKIMFRDYSSFGAFYHEDVLETITAATKRIQIDGDKSFHYEVGETITLEDCGVSANDGDYTVTAVDYNVTAVGKTTVTVSEVFSGGDDTSGTVKAQYRIKIESNIRNIEGNPVYDSLVDIEYIGSGKVITTPANLKLGYSIKIGDDYTGVFYVVLDNQLDQRAENKCYLIKFNDRFIAQDYIELDMESNGEVINFDYNVDTKTIYIWCKDAEVHKINAISFTDDKLDSGDGIVGDLEGITVTGSKKQYAITQKDNDIFLPVGSLPTLPSETFNFKSSKTNDYGSYPRITAQNRFVCDIIHDGVGTWLYMLQTYLTPGLGSLLLKISLTSPGYEILALIPTLDIGKNYRITVLSGVVYLIDPDDTYITKVEYLPAPSITKISIGYSNATSITSYGTYVYITIGGDSVSDSKLLRLDTTTDTITGTISYASNSYASHATYANGRIWVSLYKTNQVAWTSVTSFSGYVLTLDPLGLLKKPRWSAWDTNLYLYVSTEETKTYVRINVSTLSVENVSTPTFENAIDRVINAGSGQNPIVSCQDDEGSFLAYTSGSIASKKIYTNYQNDYTAAAMDTSAGIVYFGCGGANRYFKSDLSLFDFIIRIDNSGDLIHDVDWKHILFFGDYNNDPDYVLPLFNADDKLYLGYSKSDYAYNSEFDLLNHHRIIDNNDGNSSTRMLIFEDFINRWIIKGIYSQDYYRISYTWKWDNGFTVFNDLTYFATYGSNLLFHIFKQIVDIEGNVSIDKIKNVGTPRTMTITLGYETGGELIAGMRLRYYLVLKFYTGKTTFLSPPTAEVEIPQLNTSKTFTVDTVNDKIQISSHGYSNGDIVSFSSTDTLPDPLDENIDYYVINAGANDFEVSLTSGGSKIDIIDTGTGTHSCVKLNDQPIKAILSNVNLDNDLDVSLYDISVIEEIQIYRSRKMRNIDTWEDIIIVNSITKSGDVFDYSPYADETWEDNILNYTFNPFTIANVYRYPVNSMEIHKNRLILINRIDYENVNVIQYSDSDNAEAIPESNLRAIESGDGDYLVSGISVGDFLYLFKSQKIYAILGDVENGQLLDISKKIGCQYRSMITEYNNVVYFLNNDSVYRIVNNRLEDINQHRIDDLFNPDMDESIDFSNINEHGYVIHDIERKEIHWHLVRKDPYRPAGEQIKNNIILIYNVEFNYFKTYRYYKDFFIERRIEDLETKDPMVLVGDYEGNIFKITKDLNDQGHPIQYIIETKSFDLGTLSIKKLFKVIKLIGKNLDNIVISYEVDGVEYSDKIINIDNFDRSSLIVPIFSNGRSDILKIRIEGQDVNKVPIEISEILIGYNKLLGYR